MLAVKLILYFIALIAILFLAYYTTKLVGNGMGRKQGSGGIHILERTAVARDSFLLVVEIQGSVMVLGVSPAGIQKICDLESFDPKSDASRASGGESVPWEEGVFKKLLKERETGDK